MTKKTAGGRALARAEDPARRVREMEPGKKPTINDVARLANVSKKTVSRVINQSPFVKAGTRDRINQIIEEIGFSPDPQARGLAFRRSYLIGLIYDNPNPQYVVNMQLGLLDSMRGSPFELVVHPCNRDSPTFISDLRRFIERQKLMGVVLTPSVSEDERIKAVLEEIGCLYIRVASVPVDTPDHVIVSNDRLGGQAAAHHLADLGHTTVAFISGPSSFRSSHERLGGFEDGLKERGLKLAPGCIAQGAYTFDSGLECATALLALKMRPTAIFAGNDEMAVGALHAARRAGLRVPDDVSIMGFDDFQIASSAWPPLTTIRAPTREVGRLAAAKLIATNADPKAEIGRSAAAPSLVVRDSTGPAPKA